MYEQNIYCMYCNMHPLKIFIISEFSFIFQNVFNTVEPEKKNDKNKLIYRLPKYPSNVKRENCYTFPIFK